MNTAELSFRGWIHTWISPCWVCKVYVYGILYLGRLKILRTPEIRLPHRDNSPSSPWFQQGHTEITIIYPDIRIYGGFLKWGFPYKSFILVGFSIRIIRIHLFWGSPIYGNLRCRSLPAIEAFLSSQETRWFFNGVREIPDLMTRNRIIKSYPIPQKEAKLC